MRITITEDEYIRIQASKQDLRGMLWVKPFAEAGQRVLNDRGIDGEFMALLATSTYPVTYEIDYEVAPCGS